MIDRDKLNFVKRVSVFTLLWTAAATLIGEATADITLPKLFSDHMVLQRNSEVPVWGTASPGEKLVIQLDDAKYQATATANGKWSVNVRTGDAGGPFELSIASADSDLE